MKQLNLNPLEHPNWDNDKKSQIHSFCWKGGQKQAFFAVFC